MHDTTQLERYERQTERLTAAYTAATAAVDAERAALRNATAAHDAAAEACAAVQHIAAAIQQQAHAAIAAVVSRCLTAVFDQPYTFHIDFERKRGKTEAKLYFSRDGIEVDPLTAAGGGVVDVAAFALRLACVLLHRPALRPVLVLDEPWKHLSQQYRPKMRSLVLALAEEMSVQFIIVTHAEDFKMGSVISLGDD